MFYGPMPPFELTNALKVPSIRFKAEVIGYIALLGDTVAPLRIDEVSP